MPSKHHLIVRVFDNFLMFGVLLIILHGKELCSLELFYMEKFPVESKNWGGKGLVLFTWKMRILG